VHSDPAFVALRGLRALISATNSDCGYVVFYDRTSDFMEVVAAQGLSQDYLEAASRAMLGKNLMRDVIEAKRGSLIDDIAEDSRTDGALAMKAGLRAAIGMPLLIEDRQHIPRVLGALVLFGRRAGRFGSHDFDLAAAASSQIALAARQAEYYAAEKRQASSLAALYRLSHELSRLLTPRDVAQRAFPIIQEELACKRIWFGVLDELGTHLIGQGAIGPGVRRSLAALRIDLELRHDFLDEAIKGKKPVVVRTGEKMECSGLTRILKKLEVATFVIVPLVSLGQVVGVLIVEPAVPSSFFVQRRLPLLSSMANEMATVILARRFESKMADAEKMRMAGLLASGIAHNFNNLLQAVMGQASLIEMQLPEGSGLQHAASTIVESAGKGARLIRQMLTLTQQSAVSHKRFSINEMLKESIDLYKSLLGAKINFELRLVERLPEVNADYGQIQQVVTNVVANAREAVAHAREPRVEIATRTVTLSPGEVDPELAPGSYVRIDIEDNGVGMDPEALSRCFEPFYTTTNVDSDTGLGLGPTGLGLSLGYSIMKQHDGLLTVRSTQGEGTVFSMFLPAAEELPAEEQPAEPAAQAEPAEEEPRQSYALILDSEENVHISVRSTLESLGFGVRIVPSPNALLGVLKERRDIDVVVLDIDRVGDKVVSFVKKLRALRPKLIMVATSRESERWSGVLQYVAAVRVFEKPLGVWAIHSIEKDILYRRHAKGLSSQIMTERVGGAEAPAPVEPPGDAGTEAEPLNDG